MKLKINGKPVMPFDDYPAAQKIKSFVEKDFAIYTVPELRREGICGEHGARQNFPRLKAIGYAEMFDGWRYFGTPRALAAYRRKLGA